MAGEDGEAAPAGEDGLTVDPDRLGQISGELDRVEATLRLLDEGKLPSCEVCGAPIPGDPLGARCASHRQL